MAKVDPQYGIAKFQYEIIDKLPIAKEIEAGGDPNIEDYEISTYIHCEETNIYFQVRRTWSYDRGSYWHTLEDEISEKEYFKRSLSDDLPTTTVTADDIVW